MPSPTRRHRRHRSFEDTERPHPLLWYLAGGRLRFDRPGYGVPTAATLRERRIVERENRGIVGFWGTVAGFRGVRRTRGELAEVCGRIGVAEGGGKGGGDGDEGGGDGEEGAGEE
ncbi:hypothetical protein B0A54_03162 [Friedmanniomyces endolithicus]|uniref:Uncharacterized protein n=1 Tax=Friedmanniomyces endolithicus TaxID=329885 RepID=A0A4U0V8V7_9PEZI|nr:hypothetical protein B0A54_03162 [Friedmanniomyces endolithicus]